MDAATVDQRARELLDVLELGGGNRTLVVDYSAGMKKKIGLACALLHAPAAAGAGRAVRGGRPGVGRADPRHPAALRLRRRHRGLLQPRDGGRRAALRPRGDPGRRRDPAGRHPRARCAATARWRTCSCRWSAGGPRPGRSWRGCERARVRVWTFVRLKLRLTVNGLRGQTWRVALFVLGVVLAGLLRDRRLRDLRRPRPAGRRAGGRHAAHPRRRRHRAGLAVPAAGLLRRRRVAGPGPVRAAAAAPPHPDHRPVRRRRWPACPAIATLLATARHGRLRGPARRAGWPAWPSSSAWCWGCCCAWRVSRSVTSAFATALRSRRARDLATVLLAAGRRAARAAADLSRWPARRTPTGTGSPQVARVVGWTPLGAPYSLGLDVAAGRAWAVPVKLLIVAGLDRWVCCWWWSATLERAMLGHRRRRRARRRVRTGPSARRWHRLIFRWLPRDPVRRAGLPGVALLVAGDAAPGQPDHVDAWSASSCR